MKSDTQSPSWSIYTRYLVLFLIIAAVIWLSVAVAPLLQAIGIAVLLALLLNPLVNWLTKRLPLKRSGAVALVFSIFLIILAVLPVAAGSLAFTQIMSLGSDLSAAVLELQGWLLQPVVIFNYSLEPASIIENMEGSIGGSLAMLPLGSLNLLSSITTNLLWILIVIVMLFYFLKDGQRIKPWVVKHVPDDQRPELMLLIERLEGIWGRFLQIQLLLFLVLAVLLILGTLLVIWLFRSGLIRWSLLGFIFLLLVVYAAVQQVDNLWLRPRYMGRYLQLHPAVVFISLIAGLVFGGILGALVSVPLVATARDCGSYLYAKISGGTFDMQN